MDLVHGGQLNKIANQYNIPLTDWLDLSTGISPLSYPIKNIPSHVWQQLPQPSNGLINAAKDYYGTSHILATSGSQSVIENLPQLFNTHVSSKGCVWLPKVGYKEHEKSWREQKFKLCYYDQLPRIENLTDNCVVVLINPNNPTGHLVPQSQVLALLDAIESLNGWLVVDEAFMDVIQANQTVINQTDNPHLIVLRSFGKFFGLAGIRLGFVSAHPKWLNKIQNGPWQVNGPAQYIGEQALRDQHWQKQQLLSLSQMSAQFECLLQRHFDTCITGTALFKTVTLHNAEKVFNQLCKSGIYVRLCDEKDAIRFGLPTMSEFARLEFQLSQLRLSNG